MKKLLMLAIISVFSVVLIGCSADSEKSSKPTNANSTAARPAPAEDGKSDADKMDDGKSDADRTNSNH